MGSSASTRKCELSKSFFFLFNWLFCDSLAKCFVFGFRTAIPYSHSGIKIGNFGSSVIVKARLGLVAKWNEGDSLTVLFSYPWLFLSKHLRNKRNESWMKWYTDKQTDMKKIEKKSKHEIPQFAHQFFFLILFPLPFWNVLILYGQQCTIRRLHPVICKHHYL